MAHRCRHPCPRTLRTPTLCQLFRTRIGKYQVTIASLHGALRTVILMNLEPEMLHILKKA